MQASDQFHASFTLPLEKGLTVFIGYETGCALESIWTRWQKKDPFFSDS